MRARRIGLCLAVLIVLVGLVPSLDIRPDPATGEVGLLPIAAAVLASAFALATLLLLVPAWLGVRSAALAIGILLLVGILQALPVFFVPAELVPAGGVVLVAVSSLLSVTSCILVVFDFPRMLLITAALFVTIAVYAGLVAALSALLPASADRVVQTGSAVVVAIMFQPILSLMRRTIGRTLYGGRIDPAHTALRVNQRLGDGEGVVEAALEEARSALRLPLLEVIDHDTVVAAAGSGRESAATALVSLDEAAVLALRVTMREGERRLHRDDRAALALVATPLALLLRESGLLAELLTMRAAAAHARENERAALHRELHDGLGPLLTGAVFRADAARKLLGDQSDAVASTLDIVRTDLRTAIGEVRRVVYGLRPSELEQRGLWSAITRRAGAVGAEMRLPAHQADLPEAVEIAVYRIVTEALANVERHAPGAAVLVEVRLTDGAVDVRVDDEGHVAATVQDGVGLTSLRHRAGELGGDLTAGPTPGGWSVRAHIPFG